jgi:glycosyltransferase involved in cell wall biosynthesis
MLNHPFFARKRISKVFVVNNGIPSHIPEDFECTSCISSPIHEKILEVCSRSKTIGAIGRFSPEKGFDILLESFHTVIRKGYDLNLIIIGDGPERRKLEEIIARRNMNDRVFLPGYVAQASRYLKHFSVFVISSLTEGLPITLLEAMRAGVPVVSTRVGGIEEVIGGGSAGILVDPCNSDKLAEGMCALICDDELADNLSKRAEERFINSFSSKIMAENYIHVYNDIV